MAPCKAWKCANEKTKTTLIISSKCLELCKPIHLKPMSAHYVILESDRQTNIRFAGTKWLHWNMKKPLQRYQVQSHKFFPRPHNSMYEKQVQFYNMLHRSHGSSPFPTIFSLWQRPRIKFWEGSECGWWCTRVGILIPIHIARCAQTDVCAGIRVTIENQRSRYQ
jgi:hypothetical protein